MIKATLTTMVISAIITTMIKMNNNHTRCAAYLLNIVQNEGQEFCETSRIGQSCGDHGNQSKKLCVGNWPAKQHLTRQLVDLAHCCHGLQGAKILSEKQCTM
jgi:hypothetical protein